MTQTEIHEMTAQINKIEKSIRRATLLDKIFRSILYIVIVVNAVLGLARHHIEPGIAFMLGAFSVLLLYTELVHKYRARAEEGRRICSRQMQMLTAMTEGLARQVEAPGNDWRNS